MMFHVFGFFKLGSLKLASHEKALKFPFMLAVLPGFVSTWIYMFG